MSERRIESQRVWSWVYLCFAIVLIWGHWRVVGHSSPEQPTELVTTSTGLVFGALPFVVVDSSGIAPQWVGLGVGIACSLLAGYVRKRLMDWVERADSPVRSEAHPGA